MGAGILLAFLCRTHRKQIQRRMAACFFSSRRRHTSSDRDWSSDVCFSDLLARDAPPVTELVQAVGARPIFMEAERHDRLVAAVSHAAFVLSTAYVLAVAGSPDWADMQGRSEERRVGKEGRSRWSPYH